MPQTCLLLSSALVLSVVWFAADVQAQEKKKYEDPTPRKEAILKLFVEEFVNLTPGEGKFPASFQMGSRTGPDSAQPVHPVTFHYSFAIAKYEVTQELYHVIMGRNPSKWQGPRNSVEMMDWNQAVEFCKKATAELRQRKLIAADEEIRLPSEAEWEYACRAGTDTAYSFGDDVKELTKYCWYKENSKGYDPPVGAKMSNPWGLYDMHGYIWEWCADDWSETYEGAPADGSARTVPGEKDRVIRGGSWAHPADQCTSAFRAHVPATGYDDKIGFRGVLAKVKSGEKGGAK
jgi:formylglycine-generating enzyme required for sulfatase activity